MSPYEDEKNWKKKCLFFTVMGNRSQAYCLRGKKILSGMTARANINTAHVGAQEQRQKHSMNKRNIQYHNNRLFLRLSFQP